MSLVPRNSLFNFDDLFGSFFAPAASSDASTPFFTPRIDVKDNKDHYLISAELPGVKKEDIHLTLEDGVLTLEAETKQEDKEEKEGKVIRQERRYGKLMRSFNVGNNVHEGDISASFESGILTLTAPKVKETTPETRRITIK